MKVVSMEDSNGNYNMKSVTMSESSNGGVQPLRHCAGAKTISAGQSFCPTKFGERRGRQ